MPLSARVKQLGSSKEEELRHAVHLIKNAKQPELRRALTGTAFAVPGSALALPSEIDDDAVVLINKISQQRRQRCYVLGVFVLLVSVLGAATVVLLWLTNQHAPRVPPSSTMMIKKPRAAPLRAGGARGGNQSARALASLEGAAFADYSVNVRVGTQYFELIVDTGSSTFAVAASDENGGCSTYYAGSCVGQSVSADYGSGSWGGQVCEGAAITMGGQAAGSPKFAGITSQQHFLDSCDGDAGHSAINSQGIVGMAYQGLIVDQPFTPLFDSVVSTTGISNVFALQCCGWTGSSSAGTGTLTLGGYDESLFTGTLAYTPITQELYYCVEMTSPVAVASPPSPPFTDTSSTSAYYSYEDIAFLVETDINNITRHHNGTHRRRKGWQQLSTSGASSCSTIIDSGTSALVFEPSIFESVDSGIASALAAAGLPSSTAQACVSETDLIKLPCVQLQFAGNVSLSIPPHLYYQPAPSGSAACRSYMISTAGGGEPNIIGQAMMEAYYTVFDRENKRVGFAPIAGCGVQQPNTTCNGVVP